MGLGVWMILHPLSLEISDPIAGDQGLRIGEDLAGWPLRSSHGRNEQIQLLESLGKAMVQRSRVFGKPPVERMA